MGHGLDRAHLPQLLHCRDRIVVREQASIAEVGGSAGRIEHPPRRLEGDAVRVGEVDGPNETMVDHVGDLAMRLLQPVTKVEQRVLVGKVEGEVVELHRTGIGDPAGLANSSTCELAYSKNATVL